MKQGEHIDRTPHRKATVLLTGAFGRIGRAVDRDLSGRGYGVIRVGNHGRANGSALPRSPGSVMDLQADLGTPGGWMSVMDSVRSAGAHIDAFVHCAGRLIECGISPDGPGDLQKMIGDNVLSLILGCRAVVPQMVAARSGRIVVLGSLGGIVPMPYEAVYAATKFAVRGFSLSLAEELRHTGVSVSLISCGPVDSPMLAAESLHAGSIAFVNRPLSPDRVARAVVNALDHPRRETILPHSVGLLSLAAGAWSSLFRNLHPLLSVVGRVRKNRYRERIGTMYNLSGRQ